MVIDIIKMIDRFDWEEDIEATVFNQHLLKHTGFADRLLFDVDEDGQWTITAQVSSTGAEIKLEIGKSGKLAVTRVRSVEDINEVRTIAF